MGTVESHYAVMISSMRLEKIIGAVIATMICRLPNVEGDMQQSYCNVTLCCMIFQV